METNYNALRMPDLIALVREHGLIRGYSRLRKAELIAFLWDNLPPMPSPRTHTCSKTSFETYTCFKTSFKTFTCSKTPFETYACSEAFTISKASTKCTRPPKPMGLPPPYSEDSFNPYKLGRAFRRAHWSFRINGRSRMDVETFLKETRGSVVNLITENSRIRELALQTNPRHEPALGYLPTSGSKRSRLSRPEFFKKHYFL